MWKLKLKFFLLVPKALPWMFLLFIYNFVYCEGYNYCYSDAEKNLCSNKEHLLCHENALPKEGEKVVSLPMTKKIQDRILEMHNDFRNRIAGGKEKGKADETYPQASRMREMLWDEELAYTAKYHSDQCSFNHDKCHNTERFKFSGQNLGNGGLRKKILIEDIFKVLTAMYNEKNLVENAADLPKKYLASFKEAGHFTAIVNDRSAFVGCGITFCTKDKAKKKLYYMLSCNYGYTNMLNSQIYAIGTAASKCSDWDTEKSKKYENLCRNNGKIYTRK